ncbi:MAG: Cro/Cl family transcriptional regulator [Alteromonadaceae bacterium]|nr:MAG: Cro/Cl family transcriptional regulator [Alteromonadaceae bacterium]
MTPYLASSHYIDWQEPKVKAKAAGLSTGLNDPEAIAKRCFEFVRDEIKHSWDYRLNPVTCKASDVLKHGTGFCYAKSHLLAALLRANDIPTALCYQRLTISNDQPPFCLHGLNAIYLENYGWYRIDARGNNATVSAEFCPPTEKLAFEIIHEGERDLPELWSEPLAIVVDILERYHTHDEVANDLPDIPLLLLPSHNP